MYTGNFVLVFVAKLVSFLFTKRFRRFLKNKMAIWSLGTPEFYKWYLYIYIQPLFLVKDLEGSRKDYTRKLLTWCEDVVNQRSTYTRNVTTLLLSRKFNKVSNFTMMLSLIKFLDPPPTRPIIWNLQHCHVKHLNQ